MRTMTMMMMMMNISLFRIILFHCFYYKMCLAISSSNNNNNNLIERSNEFLTTNVVNDTQITAVEINYEKMHLNKTHMDEVQCTLPEPCHERLLFGKHYIDFSRLMHDSKNKILMEFTPKAGCTTAVTMFLQHLGYIRNFHYKIWPHTFRISYYNLKCGTATPCMFMDESWYRFKVVRNPYDRAVSSFLFICHEPRYSGDIVPRKEVGSLSFQTFLETIVQFPTSKIEKLGSGHAGYQALGYERHAYMHNEQHPNNTIKLFNHIVKVETIKEDLEKFVNPATGAHFLPDYKGDHLAQRHNETRSFVGNIPFDELKSRIPEDYGLFYNSYLKELVTKIYYWDIIIYNYTFPFTMIE